MTLHFIEYIVALATTCWFVDAISVQTEGDIDPLDGERWTSILVDAISAQTEVDKHPIDPSDEEFPPPVDLLETYEMSIDTFQYKFEDSSRKHFQHFKCNMFV